MECIFYKVGEVCRKILESC